MSVKKKLTEEEMAALARAAFERQDLLLPATEDEVRRLEDQILQDPIPLPESLRDPDVVWSRPRRYAAPELLPRIKRTNPRVAAEKSLARAAREGGPVPPEVEEEMRRQREAHDASGNCRSAKEDSDRTDPD